MDVHSNQRITVKEHPFQSPEKKCISFEQLAERFVFHLFQGNEILSGLTQEEYETVIGLLECAILSTDLALYFK